MKPKQKVLARLSDLKPDKKNANRGTKRGKKMIAESLLRYGAGRSVVVDKDGNVIAGNKTVEASKGREIVVVPSDGKKLVVVQRTDLSIHSKEARELAIADNRTAELGLDWDAEVLSSLNADLTQFWTEAELRRLVGETPLGETPDAKLDQADELQAKWNTKIGQAWAIGTHRILCADCTIEESWKLLFGEKKAKVCFTDPPWNVSIGGDNNPRHRQRKGLQNDKLSPELFQKFLGDFAGHLSNFVDGDLYCVLGASEWPTLDSSLRAAGFHWSATIIWVKDIFVLGRSKYHRRYEPIWYGWHKNVNSTFCGMRNLDDVWEIPRPRNSAEHPTMKPVELVARAIQNSSQPGDCVTDPFLGGGSTMVAAEKLGRSCYGMEIDPRFVAVVLERLSEMGLTPKLVDHGKETPQEAKPQTSANKPPRRGTKPRAGAVRGNRRGNTGRSGEEAQPAT